ncbi:MAG: DUF4956 domain-containing protein [Saprospirales bacterium]|nr:DUF4956 domain-containing protein [Saprospirales bacterium]|tara:strand:+ start:260 stop:868 length:609 start_codon:yes stop_codon:yes gene_type:complete
MEFLGIPFYDDDLLKLLVRLSINLSFVFLIVNVLYTKKSSKESFTFSFYVISLVVFFLCFTLKKFELGLGMALGLFAIFGILRYRTNTLPIKEMSYLFVVIGISVINALANSKMSYAEIFATNSIVSFAIFLLERRPQKVSQGRNTASIKMTYPLEEVDLSNLEVLHAKVESDSGLTIERVKIEEINRKTGEVLLSVRVLQA